MKLYHYAAKGHTVMEEGLHSFATSPHVDLGYYTYRSGKKTQAEIAEWMETFFTGYSRGIRCFTEPIQGTTKRLKSLIQNSDLIEIDLDALIRDGLVESIWVKRPLSPDDDIRQKQITELESRHQDGFELLRSPDEIDYSPINWNICDDKKGWRFAFTGFYLLVMKNGNIPPTYLKMKGN